MDGWNTTFLLGRPIFRGKLVSGRVGGGFKFYVHPDPWGDDPIWLIFFQMGWKHQLDEDEYRWIDMHIDMLI